MAVIEGRIQIAGLDELTESAHRLGANGVDKLVETAMRYSTAKIQAEARVRAPHRTGTLQRSILPEVNYPNALVGVNERYGLFIEEGTGLYGPSKKRFKGQIPFLKKGRDTGWRWINGMKARPFFWPGVQASQPYITKQFVAVLDKITETLAVGKSS